MKEILFKFFIAAMVAVATMLVSPSCQKEMAGTQDLVKEGETIQVSINAGLGGFVAADATKATATPVVRLEWAEGDKVDAYYGNNKISGDARISVTPSENRMFAKLSGEISSAGLTSGTSVITFVYSNVNNIAATNEAPTFDFSSQGGTIPFVAYATVKYDGATTLTDKMVEFKFATSVMKIAATNLGGSDITNATISGINTKVTLTPRESSETCDIAGSNKATITKTAGFDASSDKTRAIFTVGLVPEDANSNRKLTINGKKADLTSNAIASSKSYTTPCAFEEAEFVVIGGKKWATKNLGADKAEDYGKLYSWGNLAGQRGDGTFDPPFDKSSYNSTQGKSISKQDDWKMEKHDAAYNEWGGSWRMPTRQDFLDLAAEGVWFWTSSYKSTGKSGYIVYVAQHSDDKGKANMNGTWKQWSSSTNSYGDCSAATGSYSESSDEHIFFPAAGYSDGTSRSEGGIRGRYWSSTLSDANNDYAYTLRFVDSTILPEDNYSRFFGRSVRPVADLDGFTFETYVDQGSY